MLLTFNSFAKIEFTEEEKEFIKNHPKIEFGYEPNWPPYEMYEEGEYKGIIGDYVKIIEKETGIDFVPIPDITWKETLEGLKTGKIKTSICVGITEDRQKYLNFTEPYISSFMVIITRKDFEFVGGLDYLRGKTVAVPKGYYTGEVLKKDYGDVKLSIHEGIYQSLKAVSVGDADAFVGNLMVASYYIEHLGLSNLKVAAPTEYDKTHIAFAASKEWPELVSIVQKILGELTFQQKNDILQKWINVRFEHGVDMKLVWKISIYSIVGVLLVVGGFLFWNETLKKEIKHRAKVEEELAKSLQEISTQNDERKNLLNEIHHRIKNNLHMVSGLLKLQGLESGNPEVEKQLSEAVERVTSIAIVHDKIYKSENTKNLSLKDFVDVLATEIISSFSKQDLVSLKIEGDLKLKNTNPMPSIALIMNELITNSLKYAFKSTENPEISITIMEEGEIVELGYSDNGTWRKPSGENRTFGLNLIEIFVAQLEGEYTRNTENGTSYKFSLKNFYSE